MTAARSRNDAGSEVTKGGSTPCRLLTRCGRLVISTLRVGSTTVIEVVGLERVRRGVLVVRTGPKPRPQNPRENLVRIANCWCESPVGRLTLAPAGVSHFLARLRFLATLAPVPVSHWLRV
jgi:hypothetical protein